MGSEVHETDQGLTLRDFQILLIVADISHCELSGFSW